MKQLGFIISALIWATYPVLLQAQDNIPKAPVRVEWFAPELGTSKNANLRTVKMKGWTYPKSLMRINKQKALVIRQTKNVSGVSLPAPLTTYLQGLMKTKEYKKISTFDRANLLKSPTIRPEPDGYFEFEIDLPEGLVQVPVQVFRSKSVGRRFVLTFTVGKDTVSTSVPTSPERARNIKAAFLIKRKVTPEAAFAKMAEVKSRKRFTLGFGGSYQSYAQSTPEEGELEFTNLKTPSLAVFYEHIGLLWKFQFRYSSMPGAVEDAEEPFNVDEGNYTWQELSLRANYSLNPNFAFVMGLAHDQVPFADIDARDEDNQIIAMKSFAFLDWELGLNWQMKFAENFNFNIGAIASLVLNTQNSGNSELKVKSPVKYAIPMGLGYQFSENWELGFRTEYRSLNFDFKYENKDDNYQFEGDSSISAFDMLFTGSYEF